MPIIIDVLGSLSDFPVNLRDDGRDPPGADVVCRDTIKDSTFTAVHPTVRGPDGHDVISNSRQIRQLLASVL